MSTQRTIWDSELGRRLRLLEEEIGGLRSREKQLFQEHRNEVVGRRAQFIEVLGESALSDSLKQKAIDLVCKESLRLIAETPRIAFDMAEELNQRETRMALRCALAGVLAYFVRRQDLLADDAPGGYGFLDDAIILRAGLVTYRKTQGDLERSERNRAELGVLSACLPSAMASRCRLKVAGASSMFTVLHGLPDSVVNETLERLLVEPTASRLPDLAQEGRGEIPLELPLGEVEWMEETEGGSGAAFGALVFPGGSVLGLRDADEVEWLRSPGRPSATHRE